MHSLKDPRITSPIAKIAPWHCCALCNTSSETALRRSISVQVLTRIHCLLPRVVWQQIWKQLCPSALCYSWRLLTTYPNSRLLSAFECHPFQGSHVNHALKRKLWSVSKQTNFSVVADKHFTCILVLTCTSLLRLEWWELCLVILRAPKFLVVFGLYCFWYSCL